MSAILLFFTKTLIGKLITTLFIAMVPVIELRGAIPIGVAMGLEYWVAVVVSVIGNIIPVPFIIVFIKKIFAWMRKVMPKLDGLVASMEKRADKHKATVEKYAFWGLFILVAIPLPGTGAWTGALVAAMMDMDLKKAFPSVALGVIGAAIIVTTLTVLGFETLA